MAEIASTTFSQTDGSNTGALPGLSGASAPNLIDDSIRAMMGATKREHDWRNYTITSSGSANAYALGYSVAPTAYYPGSRFAFKTNFAATGAATINVNTLGAKTIKKIIAGAKTDIASGDIASGDYIDLVYDGTDFVWVNRGATSYTVNGLTEETSVDSADMLGGYDASGTAERKFSVANVLKSVNTLTEDTTPDVTSDFVLTYDASASGAKKVKLQSLAAATGDVQTFTASGTWTKPSGYAPGTMVKLQAWGGGGSGSGYAQGGGGGGGGYNERWVRLTDLGATETITIGAGGAAQTATAAGNDGGNTTIGSLLTAYGGKGGNPALGAYQGGGGGGTISKGDASCNGGGPGGGIYSTSAGTGQNSVYGGGAGGGTNFGQPGDSYWGGGGGAAGSMVAAGGDSVWGGGGGAGGYTSFNAGGTSVYGGAGGNGQSASGVQDHTAGTAPGGGGAGYHNTNGLGRAGARGQVIITVFA